MAMRKDLGGRRGHKAKIMYGRPGMDLAESCTQNSPHYWLQKKSMRGGLGVSPVELQRREQNHLSAAVQGHWHH